MIGLFQENGPCHFVNGASTPSLNPYSFNSYANMLYVDQPIGTGFSYGDDEVTSTFTAAPYVWTLLQAFYAQFPQYEVGISQIRSFYLRALRSSSAPLLFDCHNICLSSYVMASTDLKAAVEPKLWHLH